MLWLSTALGFMVFDWVAAYCSVLHCYLSSTYHGHTILVASDLHVDSLCPFASIWMRHLMAAATFYWKPVGAVVTGDMFTSVGGNASTYNVTDLWYDQLARQVKQVMHCSSTPCYFIPGNHDVPEFDLHTRYIANFGWPPQYQQMGYSFNFLLNSMDAANDGLTTSDARVDVLFTHFPTDDEHIQTRPPAQLINRTKPQWILNGHTHVARRRENVQLYGHTFHEMTLPSLNFIRSNIDGGVAGFVLVHVDPWKHISVDLCEPWRRSVLIGFKLLFLLMILYLHWRYASGRCKALMLALWFLILTADAYLMLVFMGWVELLIITAVVWCVCVLLQLNNATVYRALPIVDMQEL